MSNAATCPARVGGCSGGRTMRSPASCPHSSHDSTSAFHRWEDADSRDAASTRGGQAAGEPTSDAQVGRLAAAEFA